MVDAEQQMLKEDKEIERLCLKYIPLLDLVLIVLEYKKNFFLGQHFVEQWDVTSPQEIAADQHHLYIVSRDLGSLCRFSLQTPLTISSIQSPKISLTVPSGLDILNNELYVMDKYGITVFDLVKQQVSRKWVVGGDEYWKSVKVYEKEIYITSPTDNQVYISDLYGQKMRTVGQAKSSSYAGFFHFPCGITVDENCWYVCDRYNHRIQVFDRENDQFSYTWGENGVTLGCFMHPVSIYLSREGLCYVGDAHVVQIFDKLDGKFIFRIGETVGGGTFNYVRGLYIVGDLLYIGDRYKNRLHAYK